jgi:hypothetical protein
MPKKKSPARKTQRRKLPASRPKRSSAQAQDKALRQQLLTLLEGGAAHLGFEKAFQDFPDHLRGVKPAGTPYSAWHLLEHLRIAQWDILEFSRNPKHVSPSWPQGYWPATDDPPSNADWNASLQAFRSDLEAVRTLVKKSSTDLFARIPGGDGQTILREALLVADHNAYHLGQIVMLRRLLGAWEE